jgi:hypothetical protein
MTRVFLAAGVAALAISAPASAGPHNGGGGGKDRQAQVVRQGSGGQRAEARMQSRQSSATPRAERMQMRQSMAAPRMERQQRFAAAESPQRAERMQMRSQVQPRLSAHEQAAASRPQVQDRIAARQQAQQVRTQAQTRMAERQQVRANHVQPQVAQTQQAQANRQQLQAQIAERQQLRANAARNNLNTRIAGTNNGVGYGVGGCPPGLAGKGCTPPGIAAKQGLGAPNLLAQRQALRADRIANADAFRASRFAALTTPVVSTRMVNRVFAPAQVVQYVGQPVSTVTNYVPLAALPQSVSYLYPNTPNYYYQYGGGYLYQVDRGTSLIDALIPLIAGGVMPGTYLPQQYMNSYVPNYYGLNSFYPSSYDPGYGYGNTCNRYANGVVYQVDCVTGMVEDVVPLYAGGYGVGQMLPSAYDYYNVPMQYRSMYYPTADASYWYAPGAIYQYDPSSSLITSVAALMSPGFSVGQQLPMGYDMYNVPMAYRSTYYDTPNAWYRYNNGYIYQVNPATQLVTAIVASLLT